MRSGLKADITENGGKKNHLSKCYKAELLLQNMLVFWKSTQGHLKQCDKWAKYATREAPNVIVYSGVKVKQWGGMVAC